MKSNVLKYYIYQFFYALSFAFVAYFVLFMRERGLSFTEIGVMQSAYYFSFLIFELPTGVIADKLGRKKSLILALAVKIVALITFYHSYSFYPFLCAEVLLSLSRALQSGAGAAFLYDSLLHIKQEHKHTEIAGKSISIHFVGYTLAGICGAAIIYFHSVQHVYTFAAINSLIALFIVLLFKEPLPPQEYKDAISQTIRNYSHHLWQSVCDIRKNSTIMWLMAYASCLFVLHRAVFITLQQPFFIALAVPAFMFGILDSINSLGVAGFSYIAHNIEKRMKLNHIFILIPTILCFSLMGMGLITTKVALIFFFFQMILGIKTPILRHYVNLEIINSRQRATILSVESLVARVIFSLYALLLGYLLDNYNVQTALLTTAGFAALSMTLLFLTQPQQIRTADLRKS